MTLNSDSQTTVQGFWTFLPKKESRDKADTSELNTDYLCKKTEQKLEVSLGKKLPLRNLLHAQNITVILNVYDSVTNKLKKKKRIKICQLSAYLYDHVKCGFEFITETIFPDVLCSVLADCFFGFFS